MSDNPKSQTQAVALIKFFTREEHYLSFKKVIERIKVLEEEIEVNHVLVIGIKN